MKTLISKCALAVLVLAACGEGRITSSNGTETGSDNLTTKSGMPVLPSATGTGANTPWGGTDPSRWRPEAVLANATSAALNDAWNRSDVSDAIVAVPAKLYTSTFSEYGDGQENAVVSFEWWSGTRPPVVATLIKFKSSPTILFVRFDRSMNLGSGALELEYVAGGGSKTVSLNATKDSNGDYTAEWTVPSELGWDSLLSAQVALIHPKGWRDWFPLWFRANVRPVNDLLATVPQNEQSFSGGGSIVDHENVSSQGANGTGSTPFARLSSHDFQGRYNQTPWNPQDIHARFPNSDGSWTVTGVGQGWTWVANQPPAPFKLMYTCFDKRNPAAEASAPNGGVPSGGGWHLIGDPAETILNDLEAGPLVVGSAMNNPLPASQLPGGGFAYNLGDVLTVRWLKPGEAFITPRGASGQANYHWYYFSQSSPVCTEEWVHPAAPDAALDFAPPASGQVQVSFEADFAYTSWGENVFVVGDADALGAWDPTRAVALAATAYPSWTGAASLPAGAMVNFKFIKIDGAGNVTWENGGNRQLTVTSGASYTGTWQQ